MLKVLRNVLLTLAVLFGFAFVFVLVRVPYGSPNEQGMAYFLGGVFGHLLFSIPSWLCFRGAKRIERRMGAKEDQELLESLPS